MDDQVLALVGIRVDEATGLSDSQISALPIAQIASIGGVYGLSWLTTCLSAAVVFAATVQRRRFAHGASCGGG